MALYPGQVMARPSLRGLVAGLLEGGGSRLGGPGLAALRHELAGLQGLVAEARPPRLLIAGGPHLAGARLLRALFGGPAGPPGEAAAPSAVPPAPSAGPTAAPSPPPPALSMGPMPAPSPSLPLAPAAAPSPPPPLSPASSPWGWRPLRIERGALRVLDLTAGEAGPSRAEVRAALGAEPPDLILFLGSPEAVAAHCAPGSPEAAAVELLAQLRAWSTGEGAPPPLLAVVLEPGDEPPPPAVLGGALDAVLAALEARGLHPAGVFPLGADQGGAGAGAALDPLCAALVEALPPGVQLQMVRLLGRRTLQEKVARRLTRQAAAIAAGIAAAPLPVADILPLTALQIGLICAIGYAAGRQLSARAARELLVALGANVGAAFTLREAARALLKLALPVGGSAISAGVAFAGTWSVGEAASAYFVAGRPLGEARRLVRRLVRRRGHAAPALPDLPYRPLSGPAGP
jgi:uncharacterized protein (DUF697 family)